MILLSPPLRKSAQSSSKKSADHMVATNEDSMFDTISNWDEWNNPNYGHRQNLKEGTVAARKGIEVMIGEDRSFSEKGRSLVRTSLMASIHFIDELIDFINTTYRELTTSLCSSKKARHLVTSLLTRILKDVYDPRIGV